MKATSNEFEHAIVSSCNTGEATVELLTRLMRASFRLTVASESSSTTVLTWSAFSQLQFANTLPADGGVTYLSNVLLFSITYIPAPA